MRACELLVAAASDLSSLETSLARTDPCRVRFTFGSSRTLARQIQAGADFDLFLSANQQFVTDLVASGDADRSTVTFYAKGRLGLYSRKRLSLDQLAGPKVRHLAIANPSLAPYGLAAQQFLQAKRLLPSIQSKLVLGENVRQAFQFADSGNADAAIVSWTLVHNRGGVLLEESHDPILQYGVVPKRSKNPVAAKRFLTYLVSAPGRKVLIGHGLEPPK